MVDVPWRSSVGGEGVPKFTRRSDLQRCWRIPISINTKILIFVIFFPLLFLVFNLQKVFLPPLALESAFGAVLGQKERTEQRTCASVWEEEAEKIIC